MSFIGNLFNPAQGAGFQAQSANVVNPVTADQANQAQGQTTQNIAQQQAFAQALAAQNGIGNQSSVFNQLQGVANGTGPNPAQAQLAQATGANTANQAALMAGQRGAGSNAGLIARQAAQQGAANQQNAVGQAATLQANQSLGALGQLGGIAGQQVAQQGNALQGIGQTSLANQNSLLGAVQGQNQANVSNASQQNSANASIAGINAKNQGDFLNNAISGLGGGLGTLAPAAAKIGGAFADGGEVSAAPVDPYGSFVSALKMAHGGKVPALVSPGERYLSPKEVEKVAKGEKAPMKAGEKIPGKAKVKGANNSYANDTVPKQLEEGGIVLPRSVTQAKHPAWEAHKFITGIMKKKGSL